MASAAGCVGTFYFDLGPMGKHESAPGPEAKSGAFP
jgi:hypothetical protein